MQRRSTRWDAITRWAAGLGFKGVQLPSWDGRLIDLEKAAESKTYCDELAGVARANGVEITELGTHLQGQLVAVHPAYDEAFDALRARGRARQSEGAPEWAVQQMLWSAQGVEAPRAEVERQLLRARSPGPISIRGRSARRA